MARSDISGRSSRPGVFSLFDHTARRRLAFAFVGTSIAGLTEAVGLIALIPLLGMLGDEPGTSTHMGDGLRSGTSAVLLGVVVVAAFTVKSAYALWFRWWMLGFVYAQEARTAGNLLRRYLDAPYLIHLKRSSAELIRNMQDSTTQAYSNYVAGTVGTVTEITSIAAIFATIFVLQPVAATVVLLYLMALGTIYGRLVQGRAVEAGRSVNDASVACYNAAHHALWGVKSIKLFDARDHFVSAYAGSRIELTDARRTAHMLVELPRYVLEIAFIFGSAILAAVLIQRSSTDDALVSLGIFVVAAFRLLPGVIRLLTAITSRRVGRTGAVIVLDELATLDETHAVANNGTEPTRLRDSLVAESVSFSFDADAPVLDNVSFRLPAGTTLGIVGPSGAGKSTLIDVIVGLHTPTSGRILADGVDIARDPRAWQRSIGFVPQDVYLLNENLRANVAFGIAPDEIDDDRVALAVRLAQLDDLVNRAGAGLDLQVGERGARVSGGERQRIGIARALYRSPELLVLDEATSALDNETEHQIIEILEALRGEITIVVVAHRLSTVRNCDQILVLDGGRVDAIGSFAELTSTNELFSSMVRLGDMAVLRTAPDGS